MKLSPGEDGLPQLSNELLARAKAEEIDAYRRATPVIRSDENRVVILRADDVIGLVNDPRLIQVPGERFVALTGIPEGCVSQFLKNFVLMTNGDEHRKLRGAFNTTFSHPAIRKKQQEVRAVADTIMAALPRGEPFDFLDLCASRLPAEMIAKVLGFPIEQSRWFATKVYQFSRCLSIPYQMKDHAVIEAAAQALYNFTQETLASRQAEPRYDLLSSLVADTSARALEPDVLIYQVMGLILAGSDTTRAAFNMVVARLLGDRPLWQEVLANRDLIPNAIAEVLRLEPPVGSLPRYVAAPVELDGLTVAPGQLAGLSTISAMRDENRFDQPERFQLHRSDHAHPHPVFGGGAHRCLGEMLARIELEEGLAALMDAAPNIQLITAPSMEGFSGIRRSTPMITLIE